MIEPPHLPQQDIATIQSSRPRQQRQAQAVARRNTQSDVSFPMFARDPPLI
jgi:hypothetical protein